MNNTILVLIDGLRSDAITQAHTPAMDCLMASGTFCLTGQTVEPSLTLPAHFSLFTSLPPYSHGVLTNTGLPDMSAAGQSLFAHLKARGKSCAAFYSWEHLRNLALPGHVDYSHLQKLCTENDLEMIGGAAARHITTRRPDFTFVYLEWADVAGHIHGWMSDPYLDAVSRCDHVLGKIVDAAKTADKKGTCFNLVVLSDHGGCGQHHNTTDHPDVLTIPFIAYGKPVRKGHRLAGPVSVPDIAPTIAKLMDITPHPEWLGTVISDIFEPSSRKVPMMRKG